MYDFCYTGMLNGMMGFDTSSLTGAGDMDADSAEKLAAMAASMGSNMNIMEELQMRSKMLEEMYGRAATATTSTSSSTTANKEPGETSASTSRSHHHRKSATVTKASIETQQVDEQPEDLSIRSKSDAKESSSRDPSSEGRVSRTSGSEVAADQSDKLSESAEGRLSSASNHMEGRLSRTSEHSNNETTSSKSKETPLETDNVSSEITDEQPHTDDKTDDHMDETVT